MNINQILLENLDIDLHGLSTGVAIDTFIANYNRQVSEGICAAIKVIHGYGSTGTGGEIKARLRTLFKEHPECLEFTTGETIDGNAGYTMVYPKRVFPPVPDSIAIKVLEYLADNGKCEEKILNKFRLYGDMDVKRAIKSLEKQGFIQVKIKGKVKLYEVRK